MWKGEDKRGLARYTPPVFASLVSAISRVPACRFLFSWMAGLWSFPKQRLEIQISRPNKST